MRVVLAESRNLVRAGLRRLLEEQADTQVVGEASSGDALIALVDELHPDAVLSEIELGGLSGLEALDHIHRSHPDIAFVVVSSQTDGHRIRTALRLGAVGYVDKDADPGELAVALQSVRKKQIYLSPSISYAAVERRNDVHQDEGDVSLTPRQRQVLKLIAQGRSTRQIAAIIGVSIKTVETHRARMMSSLGLYGTNALMRYAIRTGMDYAHI